MEIVTADILNNTEGLIIHGTNASGGFGSGIAGQIRQRFPLVYESFKKMPQGENTLGKLQIVKINDSLYIGNAFTQLNYGYDGGKYTSAEAIEKALEAAFKWCHIYDFPLHAPKIGCGLGGLDWDNDVEPIFLKMSKEYPEVQVKIFEFNK